MQDNSRTNVTVIRVEANTERMFTRSTANYKSVYRCSPSSLTIWKAVQRKRLNAAC